MWSLCNETAIALAASGAAASGIEHGVMHLPLLLLLLLL